MAQLKVQGMDQIFQEMNLAEAGVGEKAQRMLEAGAQECVEAWKESIRAHGHVESGDMLDSVGIKYKNKQGTRCAEIYPLGKDSHGVRNAEKAFILHYGRSNLQGSRFVDDAERTAEERAVPAMQRIWDQSN